MTPLEIEILLHYYYSRDYDYTNLCSPAVREACERFVELGLLEEINSCSTPLKNKYIGNIDALEPYVKALCSVKLPVQTWVIPTE